MPTVTYIRLQIYAGRARLSENAVLQYHRHTDKMRVWPWPSQDGARVFPDAIQDYRRSHSMIGPCCLCPLAFPDGPDFVEACVYMCPTGPYAGEFVASCAKGRCEYFVFMERLYSKVGLNLGQYPRRVFGESVPPSVTNPSQNFTGIISQNRTSQPTRPLKRSYAMLDVTAEEVMERPASKRRAAHQMAAELFQQLDARNDPGIASHQFSGLFTKCGQCKRITTRRAFLDHTCVEVIDLTGDD